MAHRSRCVVEVPYRRRFPLHPLASPFFFVLVYQTLTLRSRLDIASCEGKETLLYILRLVRSETEWGGRPSEFGCMGGSSRRGQWPRSREQEEGKMLHDGLPVAHCDVVCLAYTYCRRGWSKNEKKLRPKEMEGNSNTNTNNVYLVRVPAVGTHYC